MNSSNWTNTTEDYDRLDQVRESMEVVHLVLCILTCVLGIPGNAFVIWIAGVKMNKMVTTIWYVNLAVADLLCCLSIPFFLVYRQLKSWPYGTAMCKILYPVLYLNMFTSVFTLTLISLDRVSMVIFPVWAQNHRSVSRARLLCALAWFLALLLCLPDLIYREVREINKKTSCVYDLPQSAYRARTVTRAVLGFFVPLLVISVCSLLIFRRVRIGRFQSQKAMRIMVGVVAAFVVCWMPYHTAWLVRLYEEGRSARVAWAVFPLAKALTYFNSCVNPVLYVFMGQDFKDRVRNSLCNFSLRRIFENAFKENTREDARENTTLSFQVTNQADTQV